MEPPESEQPVPPEVLAKLEKLMASLMYSPDVIQSMSIDEVRREISELGLDPNIVKKEIEESIRIIRGRVDYMVVYEVTENELSTLEKGNPNTIFLNFAIFLLSIASSFLIALLTTTIQSDRTFIIFTIITVVGYIIGILLLILWYRGRHSVAELIRSIRNRIPIDE